MAGSERKAEQPQKGSAPLYTVQEAAAKLNVPVTWLYERTRKNAIACHRFGKYVRLSNPRWGASKGWGHAVR